MFCFVSFFKSLSNFRAKKIRLVRYQSSIYRLSATDDWNFHLIFTRT